MGRNGGVRDAAGSARLDRGFSAWFERHFKWLIVAPAGLLMLALSVYPLLFSIWVAFVNYDFQIPGHAFVALQNFQQIVADPLAWSSLLVTILLSVTVVTMEFALGLSLALLMVDKFRGRGIDPLDRFGIAGSATLGSWSNAWCNTRVNAGFP